jgi:hypothetical protein
MNCELKLLLWCVLSGVFVLCIFECVVDQGFARSPGKFFSAIGHLKGVFCFQVKINAKKFFELLKCFELLNSRKIELVSGGLASKSRISCLNGVECELECAEFEETALRF